MVEIVNLYDPGAGFRAHPPGGIRSGKRRADPRLYPVLPGPGHERSALQDTRSRVVPAGRAHAHRKRPQSPTGGHLTALPGPVAGGQSSGRLDYIHGLDALNALSALRIRLTPMDKRALFPAVRQSGALPARPSPWAKLKTSVTTWSAGPSCKPYAPVSRKRPGLGEKGGAPAKAHPPGTPPGPGSAPPPAGAPRPALTGKRGWSIIYPDKH